MTLSEKRDRHSEVLDFLKARASLVSCLTTYLINRTILRRFIGAPAGQP